MKNPIQELDTHLEEVLNTNAFYIKILRENLGLATVRDLLTYYPRSYESLGSSLQQFADVSLTEKNVLTGTINSITPITTASRKHIVKARLEHNDESIEVIWFNHWPAKALKNGMVVTLIGKVKLDQNKQLILSAPEYDIVKKAGIQIHSGRIIPIYAETGKISSKWFREKIFALKYYFKQAIDIIPAELLKKYDLLSKSEALWQIHFPDSQELLIQARRSLSFEEMFILQLTALQRKMIYKDSQVGKKSIPFKKKMIREYLQSLSFTLTDDQKIALFEILKDLNKKVAMNRLLEGDVGSGKTIVAEIAIYMTIKAGFQAAIMVPTSVLATQHFMSIATRFKKYGIVTEFITGGLSEKQKKEIWQKISYGKINLIIGTHTLIQKYSIFYNLAFVVIDEQHRFGVTQRKQLVDYGSPHVLSMTATPIPRTLATIIYGDQDLSVIREKPLGRLTIITKIINKQNRSQNYHFIESEVLKGRQVFVVCPLVEESEKLENVKSVQEYYIELAQNIFPQYRIGILHGRIKNTEKDKILQDFKQKKIDILVATTVIEVGIDVPNATIMVIENAERFGLSALHQLRGRIGRSKMQSYCFLFTEKSSESIKTRLQAMEKYSNGFDLAEIDLKLRGSGEIFGTKQSGLTDLKITDLSDRELIKIVNTEAKAIIDDDLMLKKHPVLAYQVLKHKSFIGR